MELLAKATIVSNIQSESKHVIKWKLVMQLKSCMATFATLTWGDRRTW